MSALAETPPAIRLVCRLVALVVGIIALPFLALLLVAHALGGGR